MFQITEATRRSLKVNGLELLFPFDRPHMIPTVAFMITNSLYLVSCSICYITCLRNDVWVKFITYWLGRHDRFTYQI